MARPTLTLDEVVTKAIEEIRIVLVDCEAQHNSLVERNDINWDCYNKRNWMTEIVLLRNALSLLETGKEYKIKKKDI